MFVLFEGMADQMLSTPPLLAGGGVSSDGAHPHVLLLPVPLGNVQLVGGWGLC